LKEKNLKETPNLT